VLGRCTAGRQTCTSHGRQSAFVLHAALACDGVALRARCRDATGRSEAFVALALVELPSEDAVSSVAARVGFPLHSFFAKIGNSSSEGSQPSSCAP